MTGLRTDAALQRAIPKHTDSQTGEIVMANKPNPNLGGPDGRSSPDYGNIRLAGQRPVSLFYRGIFADAAITLVIVCGIVLAVLAVTP